MRQRWILAFIAAFLGLGAAACIIPVYIDDPGGFSRRPGMMFHRTMTFERGGAIVLDNPVGDVEIFGWDKNEVEISAERGWDRTGDRRIGVYGLGDSIPEVEINREGGLLRIRPREDGRPDDETRPLRFILNVPRSVDLRAVRTQRGRIGLGDIYGRARLEIDEGNVSVENCSGSMDVSIGRGSAEVELLDLRSDDVIRVATRQGSVTLFLESDANARVEVHAPAGRFTSEFESPAVKSEEKTRLTLGRGEGAAVTLISQDGDVRQRTAKEREGR